MHQFVSYGLIKRAQYKRAEKIAHRDGKEIGEVLIELGYVTEQSIQKYCRRILGF